MTRDAQDRRSGARASSNSNPDTISVHIVPLFFSETLAFTQQQL
ncbi:MAG: hypothetical protein ACKVT0_12175 [Planctomycetaceae bacterium]